MESVAYGGKKLLPPGWKNRRPSPSFLWLPNSESLQNLSDLSGYGMVQESLEALEAEVYVP